MPESKTGAQARAHRLGFPQAAVTRARSGGYFIAPHGITAAKARHAYADCRADGGAKGTCAAVAHNVQKRHSR